MSIKIKTEELNSICSKILYAVDTNSVADITELLELSLSNNILYMQITNREYFLKIKLATSDNEDFHATVNAELFLRLIQKMTTEYIVLEVDNNSLIISGNGEYKLPMVYDGDELLALPEITIQNETNSFDIDGAVLNSINTYNSKQLTTKGVMSPIQTLYYIDKNGAITFTTGACVNDFTLSDDVKLLMSSKLVKLFKLFKNEKVEFVLGQDPITATLVQTKVGFKTPTLELTAILPSNDADIAKFPVKIIRDRASKEYDYNILISRVELLQAINRLSIFAERSTALNRSYGRFEFTKDKVIIYDINKINKEEITYANSTTIDDDYTAVIDFYDIKSIMEISTKEFINFSFGDHQAIVCTQDNIHNVIPEIE